MSEMPDLSALFSMLSSSNNGNNENKSSMAEEMLATLMNSSSNNSANVSSDSNFNIGDNMPDMETIMKIMKVINSSNQDSPSKNLLRSLKPFLNESRKEKIDQYIKILGMTKVFEIFNELGDKQK